MSRNNKIILLIVGGVVVIAAVLGWFWWSGRQSSITNEPTDAAQPAAVTNRLIVNDNTTVAVTKDNAQTLKPAEQAAVNLERLAISFVERFGSYSNQGNLENIRDLQPLMTETMRTWSNRFIAEHQAVGADYWGVSTRALSVQTLNSDESQAVFLVSTQRQESSADGQSKIYKQDLKLTFKKVSSDWLVDAAYWQ